MIWYQFDLPNSGELIVTLNNFVPQKRSAYPFIEATIVLQACFIGMDGNIATTKTVKLGVQPAGRYYIYVSNDAAPSTDAYLLRVNFKP